MHCADVTAFGALFVALTWVTPVSAEGARVGVDLVIGLAVVEVRHLSRRHGKEPAQASAGVAAEALAKVAVL